ncbi:MAG TPA: hypothetical protein VK508_04265 [Cyclobacteriaceae bacterium]|nr:hypothetical protein [Cyclobacteriaceae bacterium]
MKKVKYIHVFGLFMMAAILSRCAGDEKVDNANLVRTFESQIPDLEKQIGISFFVHDLIVTDRSGKNFVKMRFASLDQDLLADYMQNTKYSITALTESPRRVAPNPRRPQDLLNSGEAPVDYDNSSDDYSFKIVTEVLEQSLEPGMVGFMTHVENARELKIDDSGRTKSRVWIQHASGNWPEWLHIQNKQYWDEDYYVHYKLKKKNSTIDCCWGGTWIIWTQYAEYEDWDIDGPYRVCVDLQYENSGYGYDYFWENDGATYK